MKSIINIALLIVTVTFMSCDDYLDVKPIGRVIPDAIEHYDLLLNGGTMPGIPVPELRGTSDINALSITADDYDIISSSTSPIDINISLNAQLYTWASILFNDDLRQNAWNAPYRNLYTYNTIINEIDAAAPSTGYLEADRAEIKAEALVMRAFEYWTLVNTFGKAYNSSSAASDLGVPLVTIASVAENAPQRATVQEVYDFILKDLQDAIDFLPAKPKNPIRPSKGAGYAMLSRVHLFMGNYADAITYADLALAEKNGITDYTIFPDRQPRDFSSINLRVIQQDYVLKTYGFRGRGYERGRISTDLLSIFPVNPDVSDKRRTLLMAPNFFEPSVVTAVFSRNQFTAFPNVPEMYLIKAECNARLSNADEAIAALNILGPKRIIPYTDLTIADFTTDAQLLSYALDERRKETYRTGIRLFDVKRLNLDPATAKTVIHVFEGQTFSLPPQANNWILPIPAQALGFNPDWVQNPRD